VLRTDYQLYQKVMHCMRKFISLVCVGVFVLIGLGRGSEFWISDPEWELISVAGWNLDSKLYVTGIEREEIKKRIVDLVTKANLKKSPLGSGDPVPTPRSYRRVLTFFCNANGVSASITVEGVFVIIDSKTLLEPEILDDVVNLSSEIDEILIGERLISEEVIKALK